MRSLGMWMVILSLGSFLLNFAGREFVLLMWVDRWGPAAGIAIRLGLAALGAVVFVVGGSRE